MDQLDKIQKKIIKNKIQDIAIKNDLDFKNRKIKTPIFNSIDIHQKNR